MVAKKSAEGVARALICLSGLEVGGVYLYGGGGRANHLLMGCAWRAQAFVGHWYFGYCWRLYSIKLPASLFIPRRYCVGWVGIRRKCVIAKKCGEGAASARICVVGLEGCGIWMEPAVARIIF